MRVVLSTLFFFAIVIFATASTTIGPAIGGQKGAVLKGGVSEYVPLSTTLSVVPARVDGKAMSSFFSSNFKDGVPPGMHDISLSLYFIVGFGERPYRGEVTVKGQVRGWPQVQDRGKHQETDGECVDTGRTNSEARVECGFLCGQRLRRAAGHMPFLN